jgi:hypothetical protein
LHRSFQRAEYLHSLRSHGSWIYNYLFNQCLSLLKLWVYVPFILNTSRSFPHSWLITEFVTRLTQRVPLVEQEQLTLQEHLGSHQDFSGARVTRSLVLCVCFVGRCSSLCTFSFAHCVICPSSIFRFLFFLWYHQTVYLSRSCWGVLDTTLCDQVCQWLATGRWISPGTPVFSTNRKTNRHDITEILLKVALNTITITIRYLISWRTVPRQVRIIHWYKNNKALGWHYRSLGDNSSYKVDNCIIFVSFNSSMMGVTSGAGTAHSGHTQF